MPSTPAFIDQLSRLLEPGQLLTDPADCRAYGYDNSTLQGQPLAVALPETHEQVVAIVAACRTHAVSLIARGQGTGTTGATVPLNDHTLVLSLQRMNRILELNRDNRLMVVQPGVTNQAVQDAAAEQGFFWPPDPTSAAVCTTGGNLAYNSAGPRAVKYGTPRENTLALKAVTGTGETLHTGVHTTKGVAGYNLIQLLIGSEGTLAVVTKIVLRLLPLPKLRVDLLVPFNDFQAAANTVSEIIAQRIIPTTIEFMERDIVLACERYLGKEAPFHDAAAHLLIQLDGNHREAIDADYDRVGDICLENGALDVLVALEPRDRDRLWEARRAIVDALKKESPINHMEDVVVPRAEIPALLKGIREIAERYAVRIVSFGHAGDGNVHVNVLKDDLADERWEEIIPSLVEEIYKLTLSLGGMITGEHGIGATRRQYLPLALDQAQIEIMERIRAAFDPNRILNPAKIFP